jgi:hypothetical protein
LGSSRVTAADQCQTQFIELMARYCQLGRLLPAVDDIDTDDDAEMAEVKTVLAEMAKTKAQMDALLPK